jgi:hypothetical protein
MQPSKYLIWMVTNSPATGLEHSMVMTWPLYVPNCPARKAHALLRLEGPAVGEGGLYPTRTSMSRIVDAASVRRVMATAGAGERSIRK